MGFAQTILLDGSCLGGDLGYSFSVLETLYKQKKRCFISKQDNTIVDNCECR
jgi:hypothetical protein